MRTSISLFLACATVALAVSFRTPSHDVEVLDKLNTVARSTLDLQVSTRQSGVNFVPCTDDSTCAGDRRCSSIDSGVFNACAGSNMCVCLPLHLISLVCQSADDCDQGETCLAIGTFDFCVADELAQVTADSGADFPLNFLPGVDGDSEGDANLPNTQAPSTTASVDSTLPDTAAATTATSAVSVSENPTTPETTDGGSPTVNPISGDRGDETPSATEESESEVSNVSALQLGLTLDPCQDADGCAGVRTCIDRDDGQTCSGQDDCLCFPLSPTLCENDSECDDGEGCFNAGDLVGDFVNIPIPIPDELIEVNVCASRAARDEAVCIASHSLNHISREELVFEKDTIAHVLCDINESCATPGHMVQYRGKGMMMKSYCELSSCVRQVMKVNSPKYRRGLTVPSHTEGLVFTALAARFQSRAEEGVLSAAVRIGF